MYRTTDPRFRRRLNELNQTLESANETAQSGLYIFGQEYVRPCFAGIGNCVSGCVGGVGGCWRRNKRRTGGSRAELSFDFYDDWEEEDEVEEGLLGWGSEEGTLGYGTVEQPRRQQQGGMSYARGRRKSVDGVGGGGGGSNGFWGRLFGGSKGMRYRPSAADLQNNPGTTTTRGRLGTEREALLDESEDGMGTRHRRKRSGTQASHDTGSSYSSRGDLFPSDNEDDAVPLDDEFAMVLERRNTQSGMDNSEHSSDKTHPHHNRRGKRPSAGSRTSTRRTFSSRSSKSGRREEQRSRTSSNAAPSAVMDELSAERPVVRVPIETLASGEEEEGEEEGETLLQDSLIEEEHPPLPSSLNELEQQEREVEREEEEAVERKRAEAFRAAEERGLVIPGHHDGTTRSGARQAENKSHDGSS